MKKKIILIVFIILLLFGGGGGFFYYKSKITNEFYINSELIDLKIISTSSKLETITNELIKVWKEAISNREDFNASLADKITELSTDIYSCEKEKKIIDEFIRELQSNKDIDSDVYKVIMDLYTNYLSLHTLGTSPSGSLLSYSSNVKNTIDSLLLIHGKLKILIPKK